jgi:hypothetical protein
MLPPADYLRLPVGRRPGRESDRRSRSAGGSLLSDGARGPGDQGDPSARECHILARQVARAGRRSERQTSEGPKGLAAIEWLVAAAVGVHEHRAVGFQHQQARRNRQHGIQPAGVNDLAAGDDKAHLADRSGPFGHALVPGTGTRPVGAPDRVVESFCAAQSHVLVPGTWTCPIEPLRSRRRAKKVRRGRAFSGRLDLPAHRAFPGRAMA